MGHLGFEPRTYQLKAEYSTIELMTHFYNLYYNILLVILGNKNIVYNQLNRLIKIWECSKLWKKKNLFSLMNFNVINQLITTFVIVSVGPAIISYLAYKKAL